MAAQQDNTMSTLLVIGAVFIGGFIVTKYFGNDIMAAFLQLRMWMVKGYLYIFNTNGLQMAHDLMDIYTPKEWTYAQFVQVSGDLRIYLCVPFVLIFLAYGYKVHKKNPFKKHARILTRTSLCESEVAIWPWIAPVIKLNIIEQPLDEGEWAMSDIVLKFCRRYSLLTEKNTLQKIKARKAFISQLGILWTGIDSLKPHQKALLACFLAQLNLQRKEALRGLEILSRSIATGNIDYSFVDGFIKKYAYTEISEKYMSQNAYVYNVIATVYKQAKKEGKLPPSFFVWLKVVDRPLFYTLQCVERRLPFCEAAGIFCHGLAEEVVGKKCIVPYVDKAVDGLELGLKEIKIDN